MFTQPSSHSSFSASTTNRPGLCARWAQRGIAITRNDGSHMDFTIWNASGAELLSLPLTPGILTCSLASDPMGPAAYPSSSFHHWWLGIRRGSWRTWPSSLMNWEGFENCQNWRGLQRLSQARREGVRDPKEGTNRVCGVQQLKGWVHSIAD